MRNRPIRYFTYVVGLLTGVCIVEAFLGNVTKYSVVGYSACFLFLALTYLLERKWLVGRYWQVGIYTAYWFLIGTFGSLVLAQNMGYAKMLVLHFGLSFIGSLVWCTALDPLFKYKAARGE